MSFAGGITTFNLIQKPVPVAFLVGLYAAGSTTIVQLMFAVNTYLKHFVLRFKPVILNVVHVKFLVVHRDFMNLDTEHVLEFTELCAVKF